MEIFVPKKRDKVVWKKKEGEWRSATIGKNDTNTKKTRVKWKLN